MPSRTRSLAQRKYAAPPAIVEALSPCLVAQGWALLVLTQKSFAGWSEDDAQRLGITLADVAGQKEVDVRRPVLLG
jgi:hypothetical protein